MSDGSLPLAHLPFAHLASKDFYAVHSEILGLISSHETASAAVQNFTAHARINPHTDALIYKRSKEGWEVF